MPDSKDYMAGFDQEAAEPEEGPDRSLAEQTAKALPDTIDEDDLDGDDEDLVDNTPIKVKEFKEYKIKFPNSRFVYVDYFGESIIVRSLTWQDVEDLNTSLRKVMNKMRTDTEKELKAKNPKITAEELEKELGKLQLDPRIQNYWFLKAAVVRPLDISERLMNKTIDAGLPAALIDLTNRASGFGNLDASIMSTEEV